ncbi:MAG: folate family ECF transporter S component, partial [Erysipelotrichaceae bacterium]|nr:folate family ECF transporter S component [Erysipelotrichaceae bacterium]
MIVAQIVCFIAIIVLGFVCFKSTPFRLQTRQMTLVSMFLVLALVLSYFSVMLGLFGFPTMKIGFAQLPLMLTGVFFGPGYAFIGGLLYDVLGLIVTPTSMPFLGFTLGNILVCVLPGLWTWFTPIRDYKRLGTLIAVLCAAILCVSLVYLWTYTYREAFAEKFMALTDPQRIAITVGLSGIVIAVPVFMQFAIRKQKPEHRDAMMNWFVCVFLVEVLVNLCLTPLWLKIMYQIPYMLNFFVRVLKNIVMIPLHTLLGIVVIRAVSRFIPKE